jgi:hypothetical protein
MKARVHLLSSIMFSKAIRFSFLMIFAALLLPSTARVQSGPIFRSDDPLMMDHDSLPIPRPARRRINDYYDFLENTFFNAGEKRKVRAANINTLGEVPDSSWFTNRIAPLTSDALVRGANTGSGPDTRAKLTVVAGKTQGITPGFTITDSRGDTYFLKFDPATNPEMSTGAEIISSKFFHALGYNVGEYYLINFKPSDLEISPAATIRNELDEETPLTFKFVETLLAPVSRSAEGDIRAIASKLIPGGIGPFKFYGTRSDDANDIYPHEHRRELRGYYVFCSWLNHDDSRSVNTLDAYTGESGKGFVKHYLLDFGSTLGSASLFAQKRRPGNEYMWEAGPTFKAMLSFGLWLHPWVSVPYPDYPSIGRFEADFFQPNRWKPEYPNPAFDNMDVEDAFWATRLMLRFREEDIRAVVETGMLSDKRAEDYLVQTLIKRREKIGAWWLRQVSPLDGFQVAGDALVFEDLAVKYGFDEAMTTYTASFDTFNNETGARTRIGTDVTLREGLLPLPDAITDAADRSFFVVTLGANGHSVDVFLKTVEGTLKVVGIQRN